MNRSKGCSRRLAWVGFATLALVACSGHGGHTQSDGGTPDASVAPFRFPEIAGASAVLEDRNPDPNIVEVDLRAALTTVDIAGMPFEMMTYNGRFPGPLLQAKVGDEIVVHFTNELPQATTIHWHGVRVPDSMDGTPRVQAPVEPGSSFTYRFVVREAGTFWYHPHLRAHEQVEMGLYGPIVVHGAQDPAYDAERLVMLDDLLVDLDAGAFVPFLSDHMQEMHGRLGNILLTNGVDINEIEPAPVHEGRVERWRIFNSSNARTMALSLSGASWRIVGTDGGLLRTPYSVGRIYVAVGQRYDVEVSYDRAGSVELMSHVLVSDGMGGAREVGVPVFTTDVASTGLSPREMPWPALPEPATRSETSRVTMRFDVVQDARGHLVWRINGIAHPNEPLFTFREGDTVRMQLQNAAAPEHPFHLHGQFFEILERGTFSTSQPGLKDTVLVPGGRTIEILAYLDNPGRWMAHCHILEHAELGMHTELVVTPKDGDGGVASPVGDGGHGHGGH
jgi:FtsP/CotA-like multicopper oxidase with cupredoxin domain